MRISIRKIKRAVLLVFLITTSIPTLAQVTKVRGLVVDAETGAPLPFVSVFMTNTTIGISTDLEGRYYLELRDLTSNELQASLIGYYSETKIVQLGAFNEVNFALKENPDELHAAVIKPDNRKLKRFLKTLDENRSKHNLEYYPPWGVKLYSRMEIDATNAEWLIWNPILNKTLEPIMECRDTSTVTGVPYYPVLLSETISHLYHDPSAPVDKEIIKANTITGIDPDNFLTQYTGQYMLKANLYNNNLTLFNLQIPSPISSAGQPYYNYYLVDSLMVDGRKTYCLRFHPKALVTSPMLDGEVDIDAEDFSIRSAKMRLSKAANVNWIRHIDYNMEYQRLPNGRWFPVEESMYIDFSIAVSDSSKVLSFIGKRLKVYEAPSFEDRLPDQYVKNEDPVINESIGNPIDWAQNRPVPLSKKEERIVDAINQIQHKPSYNTLYSFFRSLVVGYVEIKDAPVGFGPWAKTITYNLTEGLHLGLGFRTTRHFNQKIRLSGSIGYGFRDREIKGGAKIEYTIRRDKTRKLTLSFFKDFVQLGQGLGLLSENTFFNSLIPHRNDRQSLLLTAGVEYEHEFSRCFSTTVNIEQRRIMGNEMVPLALRDGAELHCIDVAQIHLNGRFSWSERINRGFYDKTHIFTRFPVVSIDFKGGLSSYCAPIRTSEPYVRSELSFTWNTPGSPLGFSTLRLNTGYIWGQVPYPLLKLHEGNQGWFLDNTAFSCMDYFEFASDAWFDFFLEHNFDGLLLDKIPLINRLDWREIVSFKAAIGSIRPENLDSNPIVPIPGMKDLKGAPYCEISVGIGNILRLIRIDYTWRLTRREENTRNGCLMVGVDYKF